MKKSELYWAIYKNLEAETIDLAKHVAFSSEQPKVYSMAIADLIVRCAIEIESLSKEMYKSLCEGKPKHNPKFDKVCLNLLENKYMLSKKEVNLCSPFFSFDEGDCTITPLEGASDGSESCCWNKAYQALKHDRYASLKESGTVWNLVCIMGALYLLNLYYRDKVYPLNRGFESFDARVDSNIFSVTVFDATKINTATPKLMGDNCMNNDINRATYIIKFTDDSSFTALSKAYKKDYDEIKQRLNTDPMVKEYLSKNPPTGDINPLQLFTDVHGKDKLREYLSSSTFLRLYATRKREVILNKHENIYPVVDLSKQ